MKQKPIEHAEVTISEAENKGMKALKFKDNDGDVGFDITTEVYAGGTVEWIANTGSGIKKITGIKFKTKEKLFENGPTPSSDKTKYSTTLKDGVEGTFPYTVKCVMSDDSEVAHDPQLNINPPPPPPPLA